MVTSGTLQELDLQDEVVHSPSGITFRLPGSLRQSVSPRAEIIQEGLAAIAESLQVKLEADESVFAPIFGLFPHETLFDGPIELIVPTCVGARRVWRSTIDGWEMVPSATFAGGCAKIQLSHFCDLAVSGEKSAMKAIGFLNNSGEASSGKLVVCHVGCSHCEEMVEEVYSLDKDFLLDYLKCEGCVHIGSRENPRQLQIAQNAGLDVMTMDLDFAAFPIVSEKLQAQPTSFEVAIEKKARIFKVPNAAPPSTGPASSPVLPTRP